MGWILPTLHLGLHVTFLHLKNHFPSIWWIPSTEINFSTITKNHPTLLLALHHDPKYPIDLNVPIDDVSFPPNFPIKQKTELNQRPVTKLHWLPAKNLIHFTPSTTPTLTQTTISKFDSHNIFDEFTNNFDNYTHSILHQLIHSLATTDLIHHFTPIIRSVRFCVNSNFFFYFVFLGERN